MRHYARIRVGVAGVLLVLTTALAPAQARVPVLPKNAPAATKMGDGADMEKSASTGDSWQGVEQLVKDQKLAAATTVVERLLTKAREDRDDDGITKALVRLVQFRIALHGYETAVRFLREQSWPKDEKSRVVLELFYAHSLLAYLGAYSWEIRQRERASGAGPVDLKKWTADEIYLEALKSYSSVWMRREWLGTQALGSLATYLQPNNYPPGIRDTLRDAVAYLLVDLLADSSLWRPEEANDRFKVDLEDLIDSGDSVDPADAKAHPLARLVAVLADLEEWHKGRRQPEAALEARLERLRRLYRAFDDRERQSRVLSALETAVDGKRDLPWWSMGMATVASLHQALGDLAKAHAAAQAGAALHKGSVGATASSALVATLEARDFQVQAMSHDGPGKRSLEISHRNVDKLWFRAYRVDVWKHIVDSKSYDLLPDRDDVGRLRQRRPDAEWSAALPDLGDYARHRTFVTPPLKEPGLWVIEASPRQDFALKGNRVVVVKMIVTDLVLVTRTLPLGSLEAQVVDGATGAPMRGVSVHLYGREYGKAPRSLEEQKTDEWGAVTFAKSAITSTPLFLIAGRGDNVALFSSYLYLQKPPPVKETEATLIYTDRAVYRPGQRISWKVLGWHGTRARADLRPAVQTEITVSLNDANDQTVASVKVRTNEFGTAAGAFEIPTGRLLGSWVLRASYGGSATRVRVEEYKRPTFEVAVKDPTDALRLNSVAKLAGEARYYFGLPLTQGTARWRVQRRPRFAWWWWFWYPDGAEGTRVQVVGSGQSAVGSDGQFAFEFMPSAEAKDPQAATGISYDYTVEVDVTDDGGETRSASRTFRLGFVAVEATIDLATGFVPDGQAAAMSVRRTTLDGTARAGKGTWRLLRVSAPNEVLSPADLPRLISPAGEGRAVKNTPGDLLRPRWDPDYALEKELARWQDGAEIEHGNVSHDSQGRAELQLPTVAAGVYRLRYETEDEFGVRFETWKDFVVAADKTPLPAPFAALVLTPTVPVGGRAQLFVHGGVERQVLFVDVWRGGQRLERKVVKAGQSLLEFPVREADRGGFAISVSTVVDFQELTKTISIAVPWDSKALKVEFETFRDEIKPGAKETFRVKVSGGAKGSNAAVLGAEVLALMYDRSLDFFAPYGPQSPMSLWPLSSDDPNFRSSLGTWPQDVREDDFARFVDAPSLRGDALLFERGRGIGGPGRRHRFGGAKEALSLASPAASEAAAPAAVAAGAPMADGAERLEVAGIEQKASDASRGGASSLRTNFAETAFFLPQLRTGNDGSVSFEFAVPDSVTDWNVWALAVTKDLRSGEVHRQTRSVKNLMVRPSMPRFLREGDQARLAVVVSNSTAQEITADISLQITDSDTDHDVGDEFRLGRASQRATVPPNGSTSVTFTLTAPLRLGTFAFTAKALAKGESDGEKRPIPLLPGRVHLVQSRFAALKDKGQSTRTLQFEELLDGKDSSRRNDRLVVTVDGQLFYGALKALPYLVRYPYECTEQTLNRFVSTGIMSSLFKKFPAVARAATTFAQRSTKLAPWSTADANRNMALEESPWWSEASGAKKSGESGEEDLVNTLDPKVVEHERQAALIKLAKTQAADGGFPWFGGGQPSPYFTLYVLLGLSRAAEFGVPVDKGMVQKGWRYLAEYFRREYGERLAKLDCCWEFLTFLEYVASSFPDSSWAADGLTAEERQKIRDLAFAHWRDHTPYLKSLLALVLKRAGRDRDAKLVFESVLDAAKSDPDLGTYWAPEDRAWLWYNDTIETHAVALRTLMELDPKDARAEGLVQWLFLNRQLNHWKSTRATAEVLYALAHYLNGTASLGVKEEVAVTFGDEKRTLVFAPDAPPFRHQIVIPGPEVSPQKHGKIVVEKPSRGLVFTAATWHFSTTAVVPSNGDMFKVDRQFFLRQKMGRETELLPLTEGHKLAVGDEVEVQLSLRLKYAAEYVHLRDPRGAGFEPASAVSAWRSDLGIAFYEEVRDSGANFFFESLPAGEYTFKHRVRATMAGVFRVGPATLQSLYAPEFGAYSASAQLGVGGAGG